MLIDVEGVRVGHWRHAAARTGCTVVLLPEGTVASGEVRGGAPASRDVELLAPAASVTRLDAVALCGGSAFGLAACDGVMRWCEQQGRGFETTAGVVPIVVGLSIFDLVVGDPAVRPGADEGFTAANAAGGPAGIDADLAGASGPVGAGAGATVGKWRGRERALDSGIGQATIRSGEVVVSALVVVNAWGDVVDGPPDALGLPEAEPADPFTNTSVGVLVTNSPLGKTQCLQVAKAGHAGLARSIFPVHSPFDGDALIVAATGSLGPDAAAPIELLVPMADLAVAAAVRASRRG